MDLGADPLESYTPVHAGTLGEAPAPVQAPVVSGGMEHKLEEILYAVHNLERQMEEMKRELDAIRIHLGH